MFYKLLGLLTWKAIKFYVNNKLSTKTAAAVTVVAGVAGAAIIAAVTKLRDDES